MTQSDQDIRNRLAAARLPAMPQILLRLLQLCQDDGAGMAEMARLVANDAGITSKILNVANSAAYQRSGQKTGLMQSLGALGSELIKTLVINESVYQAFNGFSSAAKIDMRPFWKHALGTAVLARDIARAMDYPQPAEAYLAGLLHDVGRLALLAAAPEDYAEHFQADDNAALCGAELRTLQITHVQAGAVVAARWKMDSFMADAILYHHEPRVRLEGAHPLIRLVHLAHQLDALDPTQPLAPDAGALCGLGAESLQEICKGAATQVTKAAGFLGIDLSGLPERNDVAQQQLAEEVRNLTLLTELGQSLSRQKDATQLLALVRQQALLQLGLEDSAVFLLDASAQTLRGASMSEAQQRLGDLALRMAGGGALTEAALQQRVAFVNSQSGLLSLTEEQLLRVFGTEHMVCLPLLAGTQCLGLLLGGAGAWQLADMQRRVRFLQGFGAQAGAALQAARLAAQPSRGEDDARLQALRQQTQDSARRVVHEVNNPLAIIKNYLEVLDDKLHRQEAVGAELGVLHEEIDRIGHIMGEWVGDAPAQLPGTLEINQAVNKLVHLLRESKFMPVAVELVVRLPAQDCEVLGSADTLKQILLNLVKNAVEVLPRGGRIEIANNGQVQRNGRLFYALSVSDNGPGIPAEHRSQLFSPVQSSKPGTNRGIGLSIVHGLVKKLGGSIACASTSPKGTVFEICLPVAGAHSVTAAARATGQHVTS